MSKSKDTYVEIIKDLSGAIAQNRFKFQRYWAIKKIYDLYMQPDDFTVIFDFACDIDVFINDELHFFQVKTSSAQKFSISKITSLSKKAKDKYSLISRLGFLENYDNVVSLNIVANNGLSEKPKDGKTVEILCFDDLNDDVKKEINKHLFDKNGKTSDLKKYFYIKSSLCTDGSYEQLLGETVKFLEENFTTSNTRAKMFLDWLIVESEKKSTYEYDSTNINHAILHKGITKQDFKGLLRKYEVSDNASIKEVEDIIKTGTDYYEQVRLQSALRDLTVGGLNSLRISNQVEIIVEYLKNNKDTLPSSITDIINELFIKIDVDNTFDSNQKKVLIILAMVKLKRGKL